MRESLPSVTRRAGGGCSTGRKVKTVPCSPILEQNELGATRCALRKMESPPRKNSLISDKHAACKMREIRRKASLKQTKLPSCRCTPLQKKGKCCIFARLCIRKDAQKLGNTCLIVPVERKSILSCTSPEKRELLRKSIVSTAPEIQSMQGRRSRPAAQSQGLPARGNAGYTAESHCLAACEEPLVRPKAVKSAPQHATSASPAQSQLSRAQSRLSSPTTEAPIGAMWSSAFRKTCGARPAIFRRKTRTCA